MTPQSLSIADLKAVIEFTKGIASQHEQNVWRACFEELCQRITEIQPPTEPKTEEK